jgi:hypothetical protein
MITADAGASVIFDRSEVDPHTHMDSLLKVLRTYSRMTIIWRMDSLRSPSILLENDNYLVHGFSS